MLWDPGRADDAMWERLHRHFTEPELVELGAVLSIAGGGQRWIKTLQIGHNEFLPGTAGGLAPKYTEELGHEGAGSDPSTGSER